MLNYYLSITYSGEGGEIPARVSTLQTGNDGLTVLGNLPHGYTFKPTNETERDRLVSYLQSINYNRGS